MHTVYVGLGANTGDRQATILAALQRLRREAAVEAVSSFYESAPAGGAAGPAFLNLAARLRTALEPAAFEAFAREVEAAVGRTSRTPFAARPIDVDVLLIDDLVADFGRFAVPHPYLAERPYNLVPLAEIAPELVEPRSGRTIAALAAAVPAAGIARKTRAVHFDANRQDETPEVRLSLNRVGVSSVRHPLRLTFGGVDATYPGEFTMVADLAPDRAGVHMSRFSELLEAATLDVLGDDPAAARPELLAELIARRIVGSQGALRADVRVRVPFALERWTPVSGKRTHETYALVAIAHAGGGGARRVVGVEVEGMTACPCAQGMVREHSQRELRAAGFSEADAARALDALPVATHNQRGRGTLVVGVPAGSEVDVRAEDLVELVEASMSSETYGLLKRPDEFFVVNKAHHNPKFVEDVVRGILARALDVYADLPDAAYLGAGCVNDESIHKHDAFAEAFGLAGEFRRELRDRVHVDRKTDLATWLGTRPSPVLAV